MSYRANSLYEEIDARNPGTIYSTNFENGIDHEENQLWFIVAPGGQSVKLTMISEHDHPTNIGRNDQTSVSIYNGDRPERANLITKWTQYKPNTSVQYKNRRHWKSNEVTSAKLFMPLHRTSRRGRVTSQTSWTRPC